MSANSAAFTGDASPNPSQQQGEPCQIPLPRFVKNQKVLSLARLITDQNALLWLAVPLCLQPVTP